MPGNDDKTTPVEVPRVRGSLDDVKGVPVAAPGEDSGPIRRAVSEAVASESGPSADDLVMAIVNHSRKSSRRHNWVTGVVVALLGSGGLVANYYATEARSKDNAQAIERHISEPMHQEGAKEVRYIKARIETVGSDMAQVKAQQTAIGAGIEELKKENVKRLQDELDDARRELRIERRRRR